MKIFLSSLLYNNYFTLTLKGLLSRKIMYRNTLFFIVFNILLICNGYCQLTSSTDSNVIKIEFCNKLLRQVNFSQLDLKTVRSYSLDTSQQLKLLCIKILQKSSDKSHETLQTFYDNINLWNSEGVYSLAAISLLQTGPKGESWLISKLRSSVNFSEKIKLITVLRSSYQGLQNESLTDFERSIDSGFYDLFYSHAAIDDVKPIVQQSIFDSAGISTNWSFTQSGGALGFIQNALVSKDKNNGSIKFVKINSEGRILLKSNHKVKLDSIGTYLARIYFHANAAPTISTLQILFENEKGDLFSGDDVFSPDAQSYIYNTPPGHWAKRTAKLNITNRNKGEYRLVIALAGNPCEVIVDDISFPAKNTIFQVPPIETMPFRIEDSVITKSEMALSEKALVSKKNFSPNIRVNGIKQTPVLHFAIPTQYGDYTGMEKIGNIKLQTINVMLSDFLGYELSRPTIWPQTDSFNFRSAIETVKWAMDRAPNSNFFIGIGIYWPQDFVSKFPEEVWINEKGQKGYGIAWEFEGFSDTLPVGKRWWPSPYSDKALQLAKSIITAFVSELRKTPYFNRIVGCHIEGGHDGQFFTGVAKDFSAPAQISFRKWIKDKYLNIENLQKAWRDSTVTFENIAIPFINDEDTSNSKDIFFNPHYGVKHADYKKFQYQRGMIIRDELAGTFKTAMKRPVIGMTWIMWGGRGQGVEDIFFKSKNLDILIAQPVYPRRVPGYLGGLRNIAMDSYAQNGKMILKELDLRTWLRNSDDEAYAIWVGTSTNLVNFKNTLRKEASQMIAKGQGFWFYDILGTMFRDTELLKEIRKTNDVYKQVEKSTAKLYKPEVAVVWVDESQFWEKQAVHTNNGMTLNSHTGFHMLEAGFVFDDLYLSDIIQNKHLQQYKVYIFKDAWRLSKEQIEFINIKLKRNGNFLIWNYAPGYVGDDGLSLSNISKLTGMNVESELALDFPQVRFNSNNSIVKGLNGIVGTGETNAIALAKGKFPDKNVLPDGYHKFFVNDSSVIPLANYKDGKIAIASKKYANWNSFYFGMLGTMDASLLSRIVKQAGVKLITEDGAGIEYNGRFLSVTAIKNGNVRISLPHKTRIVDVDTNELITETGNFSIEMISGETRWFFIL